MYGLPGTITDLCPLALTHKDSKLSCMQISGAHTLRCIFSRFSSSSRLQNIFSALITKFRTNSHILQQSFLTPVGYYKLRRLNNSPGGGAINNEGLNSILLGDMI